MGSPILFEHRLGTYVTPYTLGGQLLEIENSKEK